jgi:murein DD-endopeptidase MepM/ murein hydrolase activator NlpD
LPAAKSLVRFLNPLRDMFFRRLSTQLHPTKVLVVSLLTLALGIHLYTRRVESAVSSPYPIAVAPDFDDSLTRLPAWIARPHATIADAELALEYPFKRGATLGKVLDDLGLESADSLALIAELSEHVDVRRLRPVDRYAVLEDDQGRFLGLRINLDGKGRAEVRQRDGTWQSSWSQFVERAETRSIAGILDGSLEASISRAGGEGVVAYVMADVLQWDLDFNRDLRVGDRFEVLYEEIYLDGEFHRIGDVLALRYGNQDRLLEAYRFGEDQGHYDGAGRPLRKLFLKSPLRYSRVTSGFSSRRFHPVLKRYRAHYGVDYGAPVGTPVRVTGSGVVESVGWEGGGGKTIKVRHPNGYLTAYLHLSRYAQGLRAGARVTQGDVIGYVGSTGLATGPHLDYRMKRNGRWIDPRTLTSEPAEPIPVEQLPEFEAFRDRYRLALATGLPMDEVTQRPGEQIAELGLD